MPEIKSTTIKEIALRVKRQRNNNHSNTAILIGAGCSVSAGIPTCEGMMKEMEAKFTELLTSCDKSYQAYMDCLTASERKIFLDNYINNAKLNLSHIFLASLVREKYVDCILTTNFDNLALKALTTLNQFPAVYDLASSSDYIPGSFNYPSIVYLHGQHTGLWQMNTPEEMESVKNSIARAFDEIIAHRTLIVIGYGGNDPVLDVLKRIPRFNDNAYWVGYKGEQPDKHIQEAMFNNGRKGIYYLPKYDSDKFFFDLHNELALDSPALFSNPFLHLEETYQLVSEELKLDDMPYDLTGPARKTIQQAEKYLAGENTKDTKASKTKKVKDDLAALALNSWLGWKKNDPDKIYELIANSDSKQAKRNLSNAFVEKGNSFCAESKWELAIECNKKATLLNGSNYIAFNNYGVALDELARTKNNDEGLLNQAIEKYKKTIALKPDYYHAYYNWGIALYDLAKAKNNDEALFTQAIEKYKKTIALNPNYHEAYNNWGTALSKLAQDKNNDEALFTQAIEKYEKAVAIKPDYHKAFNNWGYALYNLAEAKNKDQGLLTQAIEKYEKAVAIKPDYHEAYHNWGNALYNLAEAKNNDIATYRQAIAIYEKGKEINKSQIGFYQGVNTCLIKILLASNNKTQAQVLQEIIANTQQAHSIKPFTESYNLACAYSIMGNTEAALKELENALANNITDVSRKHILVEDSDLINLRQLPAFLSLVNKYLPQEQTEPTLN